MEEKEEDISEASRKSRKHEPKQSAVSRDNHNSPFSLVSSCLRAREERGEKYARYCQAVELA